MGGIAIPHDVVITPGIHFTATIAGESRLKNPGMDNAVKIGCNQTNHSIICCHVQCSVFFSLFLTAGK